LDRKRILIGLLAIALCIAGGSPSAHAAERSDIFASGTVHSFGGYRFTGRLVFDTASTGYTEIGRLEVEGTHNGPYPWVMRVYTENKHFQGISGRIISQSRAGLVSKDGRFVVPLLIHTPNLKQDQFIRVPDISDKGYVTYNPPPEPGRFAHTERIIVGIDPRNANWVSGRDRVLYTTDDNVLGDITIETPFTLIFRAQFDASSTQAEYVSRLVFEVLGAP